MGRNFLVFLDIFFPWFEANESKNERFGWKTWGKEEEKSHQKINKQTQSKCLSVRHSAIKQCNIESVVKRPLAQRLKIRYKHNNRLFTATTNILIYINRGHMRNVLSFAHSCTKNSHSNIVGMLLRYMKTTCMSLCWDSLWRINSHKEVYEEKERGRQAAKKRAKETERGKWTKKTEERREVRAAGK